MKKIILGLCCGSGSWEKPYKDSDEYEVIPVTLPDGDVRTFKPPKNVYGVLAAPPCTEFTPLKTETEKDFATGMEIVNACWRIINLCGEDGNLKFWAVENPSGYLRKFLGPPAYTFQPWWFGDAWTKKTDLWGNFKEPERKYYNWTVVPNKFPRLWVRPGRKKPSYAYWHKSAINHIPQLEPFRDYIKTDADFRAITPPGFAKAFFEANQ